MYWNRAVGKNALESSQGHLSPRCEPGAGATCWPGWGMESNAPEISDVRNGLGSGWTALGPRVGSPRSRRRVFVLRPESNLRLC